MRTLSAPAVLGNHRRFFVVLIAIAAMSLLPFSTGANTFNNHRPVELKPPAADEAEDREVTLSDMAVGLDELTALLAKRATWDFSTDDRYGADTPITAGTEQKQVVGTSGRIGVLGVQVETGVALERRITPDTEVVTGRISAQAPLGTNVSVNAELELVDVDHLRNLTTHSAGEIPSAADQMRWGVGGRVKWRDLGSLRIGYELVRRRNSTSFDYVASADAGVEYSLSEKAHVAAEFNVDATPEGSRATTQVGVGYQVNRRAGLQALYQLINFSDLENRESAASKALAELTVRF